jgi:hypothetical protein
VSLPAAFGQLRAVVALVGTVLAVTVALLALYATGRAGLTSHWKVPARTFHDDLNYNVVKPVRCESPATVARWFNVRRLDRVASDRGYARFVAGSFNQPVFVFLTPKGRTCVVAYAQYRQVG